MVDALDIRRPGDRRRVLWSGHHEAPVRQAARRFDQEPLQCRLPVLAVRSEIAQVPDRGFPGRAVVLLVHRAEESDGAPRPELRGEALQQRTAGEGQVAVAVRVLAPRQILLVAAAAFRQGYGRGDVVEGDAARSGSPNQVETGR